MRTATCAAIGLLVLCALVAVAVLLDPFRPTPAGGAAPVAGPADLTVDVGGRVTMDFVLVKPGTFTMGSPKFTRVGGTDERPSFAAGEGPQHQVTIAKPFYLGRFEVTEEQWEAVMGSPPPWRSGRHHPAFALRWDDCQRFVAKLNAATTGPRYFLPSEAQWEYACRAGSTTQWCFGDDPALLGEYACHEGNSGGTTVPPAGVTPFPADGAVYNASRSPVGSKKPNAWGLYDMHGNVSEVCADAWHDDYRGAPTDGSAWGSGRPDAHVARGGGWSGDARAIRSADRGHCDAQTINGLRIARDADDAPAPALAHAPAAVPPVSDADPPPASADVEEKVMAILDGYRGKHALESADPGVQRLVAVGRPAMAVLVNVLCDEASRDEWVIRCVAERALPTLVVDEDVPMLVRRMREGHRGVECAFQNLSAPASVAAHARLIRDGVFASGLHDSARPHLRDPAVIDACCVWLSDPKYDGDLDLAIATMAELVGGTGPYRLPPGSAKDVPPNQPVPETIPEARPALVALLARPLRSDARRHVAAALVHVGEKAGIPVLLDILRSPAAGGSGDDYQRHAAGQLLNEVSGTNSYTGRAPDAYGTAARTYAEWWKHAESNLRFDPATQAWSTK